MFKFSNFLALVNNSKRVLFRFSFLSFFRNLFALADLNLIFFQTIYFFKNKLFARILLQGVKTKTVFSKFKVFSILKFFQYWVSFCIFFFIVYFLFLVKFTAFNKVLFSWFALIMFIYWLLSGFVFFLKKYQVSNFTTAIQRFWRRTFILFWLIEGSLFSVFIYLTINASNESFYGFDNSFIYKSHFYSWRFFIFKLLPLSFLLVSTYCYLIALKWNLISKHTYFIFFITVLLTYVILIEFYQFYHTLNYYSGLLWTYNLQLHSWVLDLEQRRTRLANHYFVLLLILKFWHIVFIWIFWIFCILRSLENKKFSYSLLSANYQNFIILYLFAWIFMFPWVKHYFRKLLEFNYSSLYVTKFNWQTSHLLVDIKIIYFGLSEYAGALFNPFFKKIFFFYWVPITNKVVNSSRKKDFTCYSDRNEFIKNIILRVITD